MEMRARGRRIVNDSEDSGTLLCPGPGRIDHDYSPQSDCCVGFGQGLPPSGADVAAANASAADGGTDAAAAAQGQAIEAAAVPDDNSVEGASQLERKE